jgi:hypothetical protein
MEDEGRGEKLLFDTVQQAPGLKLKRNIRAAAEGIEKKSKNSISMMVG